MSDIEPIEITAGGVTVRMLPLGWTDLVAIPREYDRITSMDLSADGSGEAFVDALLAFGERIDAYAVGSPGPSRIPPAHMREFVVRWARGVRDAAVPPPSGGSSPRRSRASRTSR